MSIKPADMQVLLPRSQEIQKGEAVRDNRTNVNSQLVSSANFKETLKNSTQVTKTQQRDMEQVRLKEDETSGRNQYGHQGKKKGDKKDPDDIGVIEPENLGKRIDIKI
jgi:hypothetical protein